MNFPASSDRAADGNAAVPGEFVLTAQDFKQIASLLHAEAGIYLPETKQALVYSRLAKRLRALGLESFREYCALVSGSNGLDERQKMISALTTNVTRFFREPHHFEHLRGHVLPPLLDEAKRGGRVRIWSAGCSNGQEPYSIALTILDMMPDANSYDVKILATDIDTNMIAEGRQGVYNRSAVSAIPAQLRERWFVPVRNASSEGWGASDELRQLVAFRELNLINRWPMQGRFQAIFCRNVVIYFEEETQNQIWARYATQLAPGGYLYIGHSERLTGPASGKFKPEGITTYKLVGGAGA